MIQGDSKGEKEVPDGDWPLMADEGFSDGKEEDSSLDKLGYGEFYDTDGALDTWSERNPRRGSGERNVII